MGTRQRRCFVIGPIGDRDAEIGSEGRQVFEDAVQVLETIIAPACTAVGLEAVRSDQVSKAGEIPERVCRSIRDDDVVIADLSGGNPNVMYELGLRHTLNKLTLQIGERGKLPFDVSAIFTIQFKRTDGGLIEARNRLESALRTGLAGEWDPVTATRVWLEAGEVPRTESSGDVIDGEEEPGLLEKLAETETAAAELVEALTGTEEPIHAIGALAAAASERFEQVRTRGSGPGAALLVADKLASDLDETAGTLEERIRAFEAVMNRFRPGVEVWLEALEEDPSNLDTAEENLNSVARMGDAAEGTVAVFSSIPESMGKAAKMSRSLRKATSRLSRAFGRLADLVAPAVEWRDRINRLRGS